MNISKQIKKQEDLVTEAVNATMRALRPAVREAVHQAYLDGMDRAHDIFTGKADEEDEDENK